MPFFLKFTGVALLSLALVACPAPTKTQTPSANTQQDATAKPNVEAALISSTPQKTTCDNQGIVQSFDSKRSNVQVKGCGKVVKVLPDDTKGSQHQKMIVSLDNTDRHTILIAHNIDLAPRVADLERGDVLKFYGEYEYTEQGGVVHWTHHDPAGRHQGGWIEKAGVRYE